MIGLAAATLALLASAPQGNDPAERVRSQAARLGADDPGERDKAVAELVKLGADALPHLEPLARSGEPELRGRIAEAVDRIYGTDPLFLFRGRDRRVTVDLKTVPQALAHEELFRPFPIPPPRYLMPLPPPEPVTLRLGNATYWEAVLAYGRASGTTLDWGRITAVRAAKKSASATSPPKGPWIFSAQGRFIKDADCIDVRLHPEPGWRPVTVSYKLVSIEDREGNSLTARFTADSGERRMGSDFHSYGLLPEIELARLKAGDAALPRGKDLRVQGIATIRLATRVEAVEFARRGFQGPLERQLSECSIRVEEFTGRPGTSGMEGTTLVVSDGDYALNCSLKGPRGWKPPPDKPFQSTIMAFATDDDGHACCNASFPYNAQMVGGGVGAGWPFHGAPTRLVFVRVLEAETIEVPVLIEGVTLRAHR